METLLAIVVGVLTATGIHQMLSWNLFRFMLGLVLIGHGVNLAILIVGRYSGSQPALVPEGSLHPTTVVANALPQALILTAIVISFGLLAFTVILIYRTYQSMGTVDSDRLRIAEASPSGEPTEKTEFGMLLTPGADRTASSAGGA